jgi:hypothetical protein
MEKLDNGFACAALRSGVPRTGNREGFLGNHLLLASLNPKSFPTLGVGQQRLFVDKMSGAAVQASTKQKTGKRRAQTMTNESFAQ